MRQIESLFLFVLVRMSGNGASKFAYLASGSQRQGAGKLVRQLL